MNLKQIPALMYHHLLSHEEQDLLTFLEHSNHTRFCFGGVRFAYTLIFNVVFYALLFVFFVGFLFYFIVIVSMFLTDELNILFVFLLQLLIMDDIS